MGSCTVRKLHKSTADRGIVKSKWHEPIPDDMSVYDFVTKPIKTNPEKIALVSLHKYLLSNILSNSLGLLNLK